MEARWLQSRCWQDLAFFKGSTGGILPCHLYLHLQHYSGSSKPCPSLSCRCVSKCLPSSSHGFLTCVSVYRRSSFYKDRNPWSRAYPKLVWPHIDLVTSPNILFPNEVTVTSSKNWDSYIFGVGTVQCITVVYHSVSVISSVRELLSILKLDTLLLLFF